MKPAKRISRSGNGRLKYACPDEKQRADPAQKKGALADALFVSLKQPT